jgi:cystathionine beta-lyase
MKKDTLLTHAGRDPRRHDGAVNTPVYHASTVVFDSVEALLSSDKMPHGVMSYGRRGSPTTFALEEAMAALEGAEGCVLAPSGLAAVALALDTFVGPGDHLLMVDSVYAPSRKVCETILKPKGVDVEYYDPAVGAGIAALLRPETKAVFLESPGSLTFEVQDVPAICAAARAAGAVTMIDNTWGAGYLFDALARGADISIQAATKYVVGHSDVMMGTLCAGGDHLERLRTAWKQRGYSTGPDDAYLALRGLRTMAVRLARHHETGLTLARWLETHPAVERVLHPGLPSCPGHDLWKRDFTGASGLFGVVLKPASAAAVAAMLEGMDLFALGFSWGGFESLMIPAFPKSIRTATAWDEAGPLVRIHAGLEDADDLIADLDAGFARLAAAS